MLIIFMNVFCSMKMYICKLVILHNFSLYFSVVHIFEIIIIVIKLLLTYQIISESLFFNPAFHVILNEFLIFMFNTCILLEIIHVHDILTCNE